MLLSLIFPVFNEFDNIDLFLKAIQRTFQNRSEINVEIIFVNDGSTDNTFDMLIYQKRIYPGIRIIDLSRNFGKEAALTAGLHFSRGDVVVPIDVDLQDPPEIILDMLDKWQEGYEVILGRRIKRNSDSWIKRTSAIWFYRIHNKICDPKIPENVGDFRLLDRKVVDALNKLNESRRFMKGLFAWIGFKTTTINYARPERVVGTSKFSSWKLWNFALEGLTGFSILPLRLWSYLGLTVAILSLAFAILIIVRVLIYGIDVPGYASVIVAITLLSGLQLIGIGVIGEYLGRAYIESKRRPVYVIRNIYD